MTKPSVSPTDAAGPTAADASYVSGRVRAMYDEIGWSEEDGVTYDGRTSEDLRSSSRDYISKTRLRVGRHLPASGDRLLDMASGPIQYPEYMTFSEGFVTRVCVDLSQRALDGARRKLGDRGEYLCGDFFEMPMASDSIDAAISLHTIYHIHETRQAAVVRKLIDVVKRGSPVVIVYSNPDNLVSRILRPIRRIAGRDHNLDSSSPDRIYFKPQRLDWWKQFEDVADVQIFPWRTFSTPVQNRLFPGNGLGKSMLALLFRAEDRFPKFFTRVGVYPVIVLTKRDAAAPI